MFNRLDYTISQLNKNKTVLKQLNWLKKYIVEYPLARYYVTDTVTTSTGGIAFVPRGSVETPYDIPVHEGDLIFAPHIEGTPIYIVTDVSDPVEYTVSLLGYMQGPQGVQGPIGPQGPQGEQGPQGPRGFTGFGMYISTNTSLSSSTTQISISDVVEPQGRILSSSGDIIIGVNSQNVPMFLTTNVSNGIATVTFYGYMGSTLSADSLFELIEGSDSIVVDLNEEGTALEVHLDASVMAKINRALLLPVSAPSEMSYVVILENNSQQNIPQSTLLEGFSQLFLQKPQNITEAGFIVIDTEGLTNVLTLDMFMSFVTPQFYYHSVEIKLTDDTSNTLGYILLNNISLKDATYSALTDIQVNGLSVPFTVGPIVYLSTNSISYSVLGITINQSTNKVKITLIDIQGNVTQVEGNATINNDNLTLLK